MYIYIYIRLIVALDKFCDLIEFQGSKTLVKTSAASKRSSRFTSSTCAMALGFSGTRESRVVGGIEKFGSTVLEHVNIYICIYIHIYIYVCIYIYTNQNSETEFLIPCDCGPYWNNLMCQLQLLCEAALILSYWSTYSEQSSWNILQLATCSFIFHMLSFPGFWKNKTTCFFCQKCMFCS